MDAFHSFIPSFFIEGERTPGTRGADLLEDFIVKRGRQATGQMNTQINVIAQCSKCSRGCWESHEGEGGQIQCSQQHYSQ